MQIIKSPTRLGGIRRRQQRDCRLSIDNLLSCSPVVTNGLLNVPESLGGGEMRISSNDIVLV
jgi:hypothetical protein